MRHALGEKALAPLSRCDRALPGGKLLHGVDADVAQSLEQPVQDVDRGAGVGERTVRRHGAGPEDPGQRRKSAVVGLVARQRPAGEPRGIENVEARPGVAQVFACRLEEANVERRVVSDEHAAPCELEEGRQDRLEAGSGGHHRVGDPGQNRDERRDRQARPDQGLELALDLAPTDFDGPDLGDLARCG